MREFRDIGMPPVHRHAFFALGDRVRDLGGNGAGSLQVERLPEEERPLSTSTLALHLLLSVVPSAERDGDRAGVRLVEV